MKTLDTFTRSYIGAALWSSTDNSNEQGGDPLDSNYSESDIAPETLQRMAEDCAAFQADNAEDLASADIEASRAGFLFWLNRNGHGSGFWDEVSGSHELRTVFMRLSAASEVWGDFNLYVGDDGQIYGS